MTVGVLKLYKSKPYDLRQETGGDFYANTIKLEAARRNHSEVAGFVETPFRLL